MKRTLLGRNSLLIFLFLCLIGCSGEPAEKVWVNAPGWSRAVRVGETAVPDLVPVAVDNAGISYLLLLNKQDDNIYPLIKAIDGNAKELWATQIDTILTAPNEPNLIWDGQHLRAYWVDSNKLYEARLDNAGNITTSPTLLSGDTTVETFAITLNPTNQPIVWYSGTRRNPGLYAIFSDQDTPILVDETGIRPSIAFDRLGTLHAVWLDYPTGYNAVVIYYATYENGEFMPNAERAIIDLNETFNATKILRDVTYGADYRNSYIFWVEEARTGPDAGSVSANYITYPHGQIEDVTDPIRLLIPNEYAPNYVSVTTGFDAGDRNILARQITSLTPFISDIRTLSSNETELAFISRASVLNQYRDTDPQIVVTYLQGSAIHSTQLLTFTTDPSESPTIARDNQNHLYATWIERSSTGFSVYFASSTPSLKDSLNNISGSDVLFLSRELSFGLLAGVVLSPFLIGIWVFVPGVILGATSYFRNQDRKYWKIGTIATIILGLIAYNAVKIGTLPGILTYVPFSLWLPFIPKWLQIPLQWIVPAFIATIALITAYRYTYKQNSYNVLYFLLIFGAVDGALTAAIYGALIYGAL